jgi:hypothetical protein
MTRLLLSALVAVSFVPAASAAIPLPNTYWHGPSFDVAGSAPPMQHAREDFDRMVEIAPAKGRPAIGSIAIDWCAHANTENGSGGALARALSGMEQRGWFWEDITRVASYLCVNPRDAQYQRQAGYFIQGLVNLTGQTATEVLADLRFRMDGKRWNAEREATCKRYEVSSEASVEERELAEAHRDMFGCAYDAVPGWWLDRANTKIDHHLDRTAAEPSQLLRSYSVTRCMAVPSKPEQIVLQYAMCSRDLQALDVATLDRELANDKHNAYARTIARQQLARTKMRGTEFEAKVREVAAKDAALEQLAYKVPSAAWDRAIARHRSNAAPLARAAAFETVFYGPSKKAARGCSTQLRDDFRAYVRAGKPKDLAAVDALATDDVGVLLLSRLSACEALDGGGHAAVMLYTLGNAARTARGPRLAVYHALVDALSEIRSDRERFPLELRDLPSMPPMQIWADTYSQASSSVLAMQKAAGVVKKVTTVEDGVTVEFATESWTEDDWNCVDTTKVFKIDDGRVIYHQSCKKVGKRTVKRTAPSIWIPSAYAAKVGAGTFVEFDYDLNKKHDKAIAMPRVVFKDKQRTTLLAAYGIAL